MKNRICFCLIALFFTLTVSAGEWSEETGKAFYSCGLINLRVDFSRAVIMNLDSADCAKFLATEKGKSADYLEILCKRFRNRLAEEASTKNQKFVINQKADFTFDITVNKVTDSAAILGEARIYPNNNPNDAISYDLNLGDGRMNTFENLFIEAAENMGQSIRIMMRGKGHMGIFHRCFYKK